MIALPALSYGSEMLPSMVVHLVASPGTECLGTEAAPAELLSCSVTVSTNGSDWPVCFSVNHALPAQPPPESMPERFCRNFSVYLFKCSSLSCQPKAYYKHLCHHP